MSLARKKHSKMFAMNNRSNRSYSGATLKSSQYYGFGPDPVVAALLNLTLNQFRNRDHNLIKSQIGGNALKAIETDVKIWVGFMKRRTGIDIPWEVIYSNLLTEGILNIIPEEKKDLSKSNFLYQSPNKISEFLDTQRSQTTQTSGDDGAGYLITIKNKATLGGVPIQLLQHLDCFTGDPTANEAGAITTLRSDAPDGFKAGTLSYNELIEVHVAYFLAIAINTYNMLVSRGLIKQSGNPVQQLNQLLRRPGFVSTVLYNRNSPTLGAELLDGMKINIPKDEKAEGKGHWTYKLPFRGDGTTGSAKSLVISKIGTVMTTQTGLGNQWLEMVKKQYGK